MKTAAAALVLAALVLAGMVRLSERPEPYSGRPERPDCRPVPGLAANQRLCGAIVYTIQGGEWAYTGPLTPMPGVPAR